MLNFQKKNRKGFTLVELLVVIAIIGILAAIAIPRFTDATASARGAKIVADLRTIDSAVSLYNAQYGVYPSAISSLTGTANLLAAEPKPQIGSAKINGRDYTITKNVYTIDGTSTKAGRALLGGNPVETFVDGTATSGF